MSLRYGLGDSVSISTYIGSPGEIGVNTTTKTIHIFDGVTSGGTSLAKSSEVGGGSGVGIQSAGTVIGTGITTLNFIGAGNTFTYNPATKTVNISISNAGGLGVITKQSFSVTSSQSVFTLTESYSPGLIDVFVNGIRLATGDFTETNSTTITLTSPANSGDVIEFQAYSTRVENTVLQSTLENLIVTGITTLGATVTSTGTTTLIVNGDARITGILTIGTSSLTLDGSNNQITIGTGVTIQETGSASFTQGITADSLSVTNDATVGGALTVTGNLTVNGTQTVINTTILEVEDLNVGIASTATKLTNSQLDGAGITIYGSQGDKTLTWDNANSRMAFSTNVYAPKYYGDGSNLQGVVSGIALSESGASRGSSITTINFSGATVTTASGGISTVTIASAGLGTEALTSSGIVTTLNLTKQDHKVTATGITTITVSGGTEGDSHTVRIVNSGIATVGFSTYFLFPSGSPPVLPTASGAISIVSFTVHRVGTAGTQLLAGASLNFS